MTARNTARTAAPDTKKIDRHLPAARTFEPRLWKDITGRFQVRAAFQSYANGIAKLRKEDSTIVNISLEKLGLEDQAYVRSLAR
jgi:hypothetical protein